MSGLITTEKLLREQEILYRRSTLLNEEGRLAKVAELARMASMELLAFIILDRLHDLRKVEIIHHRNPEIAGYFSISGKKRSVNISIERLRKISPEAVEKVYSFLNISEIEPSLNGLQWNLVAGFLTPKRKVCAHVFTPKIVIVTWNSPGRSNFGTTTRSTTPE